MWIETRIGGLFVKQICAWAGLSAVMLTAFVCGTLLIKMQKLIHTKVSLSEFEITPWWFFCLGLSALVRQCCVGIFFKSFLATDTMRELLRRQKPTQFVITSHPSLWWQACCPAFKCGPWEELHINKYFFLENWWEDFSYALVHFKHALAFSIRQDRDWFSLQIIFNSL